MIPVESLRSVLFLNAFTHFSIGMAIVALDGTWQNVNDALCRIVGYSREELVRLHFQDMTHPEDLSADLALIDRLQRGEIESSNLEKRYIRKNCTILWILLPNSLPRDDNGDPEFFIAQSIDITDPKQKFPWPIARMVLEHHERLDGIGYSNGLRDEQILLESKILTVWKPWARIARIGREWGSRRR